MNIQDEFENFEACMEGHETALHIFEAGAKAMLEHVRGKQEPVAWAETDEHGEIAWGEEGCFSNDPAWIENPIPLYAHPAPAVAQEPVHFRAVLCGEQQDQAFGVVPKVVGFVDKKAAEQFILEKRDFQGWRYSLEPLYTEAPAVADFSDAYQGAQEDLAIWKKRALEAEELNRKFIAQINDETFMGEPAQPVQPPQPVQPSGAQGEPVAFPGDALRWALNECGVKQTDNGVHFSESGLAKLALILARSYAVKGLAQKTELPVFNNDAAWDLAQKVRTDLDRKCCPGPFMDLAMELINKHYTHTAPYVDVNDQILGALKDAATAFDRINDWLEGRGYGGLKPSEIIVLNKLNSAIAAAEAAKKAGM